MKPLPLFDDSVCSICLLEKDAQWSFDDGSWVCNDCVTKTHEGLTGMVAAETLEAAASVDDTYYGEIYGLRERFDVRGRTADYLRCHDSSGG